MVHSSESTSGAVAVTQAAVDGLICELRNQVEKLKDSNRQLQAAIDDGDRDPEFRAAIGVCPVILGKVHRWPPRNPGIRSCGRLKDCKHRTVNSLNSIGGSRSRAACSEQGGRGGGAQQLLPLSWWCEVSLRKARLLHHSSHVRPSR
jgi:hypothetical protein